MKKKLAVICIGLLCFAVSGCGANDAMDNSKKKAECSNTGCVWQENNTCNCNN